MKDARYLPARFEIYFTTTRPILHATPSFVEISTRFAISRTRLFSGHE